MINAWTMTMTGQTALATVLSPHVSFISLLSVPFLSLPVPFCAALHEPPLQPQIHDASAPTAAIRFLSPIVGAGHPVKTAKLQAQGVRGLEHRLPVLAGGALPAAVRAPVVSAQVQQQRRIPQPLPPSLGPIG